ncbi:MAG: bifunctional glutamate N-acetyltransferase/amino-acid acetyltransferase ArgJ [Nitrospira sp.]|nr:bifunctional glutamate N-acetyltransferase/amino-acid acetyltransferase ArgJ [Nitrospira sp.]
MKRTPNTKQIIVPGFKFSGIKSGIKESGGKDLALIYSETPAVIAGVFTTNRIKAAPIKLAIKNITSNKGQAIIINSGNANACTGKKGDKDAKEVNTELARKLGLSSKMVYVSSTGIIGRPLPVKKIITALPELIDDLSPLSLNKAASAIMTTDTFPKLISRRIKIGGKTGTIAGIAKGAGMIRPDMATMLCFLFTDIAVNAKPLDSALRKAVNMSLNRLTIDNEMSTNDTAMLMSNGSLGNTPLTKTSPYYRKFEDTLSDVTYELSKMIAKDGEGATKTIEVLVKGAKSESDAEKAASAIANSMLVKTAVYGKDPNWGRVISAAGASGAKLVENKINIFFNKVKLVSNGVGTGREKAAAVNLTNREITITVDLGAGKQSAKVLTCDLTEKYIEINAHYTT